MPFRSDPEHESQSGGGPQGRYPVPVAQIIEAQKDGELAVHAGITPGLSPYIADRTPQGRYLAMMWLRGYRAEQYRLANDSGSGDIR